MMRTQLSSLSANFAERVHSAPISAAWTITILALIVRVAYVLVAPQVDPILQRDPLHGDASGYHLLAINLTEGAGLTWDGETPTSFRMPGYPGFLALLYWAFQPALPTVRLVQAILGALTVLPVMAIADRLGGRRVAVLTGLGVALHPILIYMTGWVYSETLFILLLWTSLWYLAKTIGNGSFLQALLVGLLLGLTTHVRPEIMPFPLLMLGVGVLLRWSRRKLAWIGVLQVGVWLAITPWVVRNYMAHQAPVLLTTNTGAVLYGGNNDRAEGGYYLDVPFVLPGYTEYESNNELTRRAQDWILSHPADYLQLLPKKLYKFFAPAEMEHSGSPLGKWTWPVNLMYAGFLFMAARGGILGVRRESQLAWLLLSVVAWYVLISLILYGGTRVALPVAPSLVILAAFGIDPMMRRSRRNIG